MTERYLPRHRAGDATGPDRIHARPTSPADRPGTDRRTRRVGGSWLVLVATSMAMGLAVALFLGGPTGQRPATRVRAMASGGQAWPVDTALSHAAPWAAVRAVSAAELAVLPQATTWGTVPAAPLDPAPEQVPSEELVSPTATVPVFASPGGRAIAALPAQQPDGNHRPVGPTVVPVIATQPGWAQVLLPSRPNGATGWIDTDDPRITLSTTPYLITIDRVHFRLTLLRSGVAVGQWTVGVGMVRAAGGGRQSITPVGRSFILADIRIVHPTYSPLILPLGLHSDVYQSFSGGPATIGIHTWTYSNAVYGTASSNGCIRVPAAALAVLATHVPTGTPVLIS